MNAFSPPLAFFGMGDTEVLLVMVAVLIFFGGEKLPDFARGLGKAIRELKRATSDVEREFKRVIDEAEQVTSPPAFTPLPAPGIVNQAVITEGAAPPAKNPAAEPPAASASESHHSDA